MKARSCLAKPLAAAILAACACLAGCATEPPVRLSRTTVVLLPDEDGIVGAVSVSTAAGSKALDEAFSSVTVTGAGAAPTSAQANDRETVGAAYAGLLKAQPLKPRTFVLYFMLDKTVLTEASKALLPEVLKAARERKPTEITVFGHADASGTKEGNLKLSAERAHVVADWLKKSDPTLDRIEVQFFGDAEPVVRSDARTAEPRNRRAEIMVL